MEFWLTGPVNNILHIQQRIEKDQDSWATHGFGDWAVCVASSEDMIGFCGLHFVEGMSEVNLGFVLDRVSWGKGYGTEAAVAALKFGFEHTAIDEVVGVAAPDNQPAIALLVKCGMSFAKNILRRSKTRVVYSIRRLT